MSHLLLGLLAAFAAAGFYSGGIALQAAEARGMPAEHGLRISLLRRLIRRPRWIAGIGLDLVGWALQAVALGLAPLTVVQPTLAVGLVFLLAIGSRALGESVGRREVLCVLAVAAGVAGLGWAAPEHVDRHDTGSTLAIALALLGAAALVPFAVARARGAGAPLIAIAAGLAFAWDGVATKLFADDFTQRAFPGVVLWLAGMIGAATLGTLCENSALQRRPVTQVAPLVLAAATVVPVVLAPFVAGEGWAHGPLVRTILVGSLVLVIGGAVQLTRSPAVAAVLATDARSRRSGTGRRPRARRKATTLPTAAADARASESTTTTTIAPGRSSPPGRNA
jgi:drug/metabolite transporter (DMT)-like permease